MRSPFTGAPTIFLYERVPGGVGFAERLYAMRHELLRAAAGLIADCACQAGCPSCVGPPIELGEGGKQAVLALLERLGARPPAQLRSALVRALATCRCSPTAATRADAGAPGGPLAGGLRNVPAEAGGGLRRRE